MDTYCTRNKNSFCRVFTQDFDQENQGLYMMTDRQTLIENYMYEMIVN